jgi:addiction module RelE/StbE family toxin
MGYKVILSPQSIEDLAAIVRRIAKDDPDVAQRIGHALIDRVSILENFPLLGPPYAKRPGVRRLVSRPYIIFYRVRMEQNCVDVLRYWHGAQRDPSLMQ